MSFLRGVGRGWGPAWSAYLFKRTVPEVQPLFEKAKALYLANCPGLKYSQHPYCKFVWPGGEMLTLRHMLDIDDYADLHGSAVCQIMFEELTNWPTNEVYLRCLSLLRSSHPEASKMMQVWSTTNPGQIGHCLPFGEVLTANRGWVDIKEATVQDTVITVDATGTAKVGSISDVVRIQYEGDIVSRVGRGLHMEFTPNHRLPLQSTDGTTFELRPFNELPGQAAIKRCADDWEGYYPDTFTVPPYKHKRALKLKQPDTLSAESYAELMGWFLSEGSTVDRDKAVSIAQMKSQGRDRIRSLLTKSGFVFSEGATQFTFYSAKWWQYMRQFGKCRDKFIPHELKQAPKKILQILLDALMMGDGSANIYYTTSKQLADDVAEICVKLGLRVYISSRQRKNRKGLSYAVNMSEPAAVNMVTGNHLYNVSSVNNFVNVEKKPFNGMVYCLTVPETETFFVRQNGCVWLSGNTWVKKRWKLPEMTNKIIFDDTDAEEIAKWSDDPLVNVAPRPRIAIFIDVRKNDIFMKQNPTYLADLAREAPNDAVRAAWIDGSWDIISGGMFDSNWDRRYHVVKPFPIPKSWKIDRSFDAGSSTPFSVLWYAESDGSDYVDNEGKWRSSVAGDIFIIKEWYGTNGQPNTGLKLTPQEISKGIIERELDWGIYNRVVPGPADNAVHTESIVGINVAKLMSEPVRMDDGTVYPNGVQWTRSDKHNTRVLGWNLVNQYLKNALPDPKGLTPREHPGLFIFEGTKYTIDMLPVTPRDDKKPEDIPTRGEFHIQDSLRYRLLANGRSISVGPLVGLH